MKNQMPKGPMIKSKEAPSSTGSLVKLTADECRELCAAVGVEYLEGYEERVVQYTLSDESVDRQGDIVKQDGGDFANFLKNPVVLPMHNSWTMPIGNIIKLWGDVAAKETRGYVLFPDKRVDTSGESDRYFRFAKARFMRAGSIGFRYLEYKSPTKEEREVLGMHEHYGWVITKWELMEFSLCPVPANPNAVSEALNKGIITREDAEKLNEGEPTMKLKDVESMIAKGIAEAVKELAKNSDGEKDLKKKSRATLAQALRDIADDLEGEEEEEEDKSADDEEDEEEGKNGKEGDEEDEDEEEKSVEIGNRYTSIQKTLDGMKAKKT